MDSAGRNASVFIGIFIWSADIIAASSHFFSMNFGPLGALAWLVVGIAAIYFVVCALFTVYLSVFQYFRFIPR